MTYWQRQTGRALAISILAAASTCETSAHEKGDLDAEEEQLILMDLNTEWAAKGGEVGRDCFATDILTFTWRIGDVDKKDLEHIEAGDKLRFGSQRKPTGLYVERKPRGTSLFEPWGNHDTGSGPIWTPDCSINPPGRYVLQGIVEVEDCPHQVLIYRIANAPSDKNFPEILDKKQIYIDFSVHASDSETEACKDHESGPKDIHPGHAHGYD